MSSIVSHTLDKYFESTPIGSVAKAIGNTLYGIDHRLTPSAVPSNVDQYGYTFFVRPQLNLTEGNCRMDRKFFQILNDNYTSIQTYARSILDPRLENGYKNPVAFGFGDQTDIIKRTIAGVKCPLVQNENPFIPVLTNQLRSVSGWPDITLPTFTTPQGIYNEEMVLGDGIVSNYSSFDITATFRNTRGDPIVYMFYVWMNYIANVFEGKMMPYADFIIENEIDYNTRIYRFDLDRERRFVTKVAATGASIPTALSVGQFFDYNSERPYNDQTKEISIRFSSMGALYMDEILLNEFNRTVNIFNPSMRVVNGYDGRIPLTDPSNILPNKMVKIPWELLTIFNNRGIPRINLKTFEFEWWIEKDVYLARLADYKKNGITKSIYVGPHADSYYLGSYGA